MVNRATVAFRNAAVDPAAEPELSGRAISPSAYPAGCAQAITAMARKLACLFYRLIKHGQQYVDKGTEYYEASIVSSRSAP